MIFFLLTTRLTLENPTSLLVIDNLAAFFNEWRAFIL
jgi:hypothetical protein